MYFLIEDDDLPEKLSQLWFKKEFDSKPVYNRHFLKTKIKSHGDEITHFYDKKALKVGSNYTWIRLLKEIKAIIRKCF